MRLTIDNCEVGYFTTLSADLSGNGNLIKLAAKVGNRLFFRWIKPPMSIQMSTDFGLQLRRSDLFLDSKKLPIVPLKAALMDFLKFLRSSEKRVLLVSHSAQLESVFLVQALKRVGMLMMFDGVIAGFSDTFLILRKQFPRRQRVGQFTLTVLAIDFLGKIYLTNYLYRTPNDLNVMTELGIKIITKPVLIESSKSFEEFITSGMEANNISEIYQAAKHLKHAQHEEYWREMSKGLQRRSTSTEVSHRSGSGTLRDSLSVQKKENQPQQNGRTDWFVEGEHSAHQCLDYQDSSQVPIDQDERDQEYNYQDSSQVPVDQDRCVQKLIQGFDYQNSSQVPVGRDRFDQECHYQYSNQVPVDQDRRLQKLIQGFDYQNSSQVPVGRNRLDQELIQEFNYQDSSQVPVDQDRRVQKLIQGFDYQSSSQVPVGQEFNYQNSNQVQVSRDRLGQELIQEFNYQDSSQVPVGQEFNYQDSSQVPVYQDRRVHEFDYQSSIQVSVDQEYNYQNSNQVQVGRDRLGQELIQQFNYQDSSQFPVFQELIQEYNYQDQRDRFRRDQELIQEFNQRNYALDF